MKRDGLGLWLFAGGFILAIAFGLSTYISLSQALRPSSRSGSDLFRDSGNVAILEIKGAIMEPDSILEQIEEIDERGDLKAVVVRINSPGGAVGPSQEIYDAILALRAKKKVVCSLGDLAASGGYYIAAACEKIVANPGTLTGSIGVIMHFMNLKDLYSWAKIEPVTLKAGKFKDIGSESRAMTSDEKELLQKMLDQVHGQFKDAVAKGRGLSRAFVDSYADGRVFSGEEAKKLGFVDELGGEKVAVRLAAKMAGIKGEPKIVRKFAHKHSRLDDLFDALPDSLTKLVPFSHLAGLQLNPGVPYFLPSFMFTNKP